MLSVRSITSTDGNNAIKNHDGERTFRLTIGTLVVAPDARNLLHRGRTRTQILDIRHNHLVDRQLLALRGRQPAHLLAVVASAGAVRAAAAVRVLTVRGVDRRVAAPMVIRRRIAAAATRRGRAMRGSESAAATGRGWQAAIRGRMEGWHAVRGWHRRAAPLSVVHRGTRHRRHRLRYHVRRLRMRYHARWRRRRRVRRVRPRVRRRRVRRRVRVATSRVRVRLRAVRRTRLRHRRMLMVGARGARRLEHELARRGTRGRRSGVRTGAAAIHRSAAADRTMLLARRGVDAIVARRGGRVMVRRVVLVVAVHVSVHVVAMVVLVRLCGRWLVLCGSRRRLMQIVATGTAGGGSAMAVARLVVRVVARRRLLRGRLLDEGVVVVRRLLLRWVPVLRHSGTKRSMETENEMC